MSLVKYSNKIITIKTKTISCHRLTKKCQIQRKKSHFLTSYISLVQLYRVHDPSCISCLHQLQKLNEDIAMNDSIQEAHGRYNCSNSMARNNRNRIQESHYNNYSNMPRSTEALWSTHQHTRYTQQSEGIATIIQAPDIR